MKSQLHKQLFGIVCCSVSFLKALLQKIFTWEVEKEIKREPSLDCIISNRLKQLFEEREG